MAGELPESLTTDAGLRAVLAECEAAPHRTWRIGRVAPIAAAFLEERSGEAGRARMNALRPRSWCPPESTLRAMVYESHRLPNSLWPADRVAALAASLLDLRGVPRK